MKAFVFNTLFTPFGLFLIFRDIFPSIWCIQYLITENSYRGIVLLHLLYLLIQAALICTLISYIPRIAKRCRVNFIGNSRYLLNSRAIRYSVISTISIVFILTYVLANNALPLLSLGGSDAIVLLGESHKILIWASFGVINVLSTILIISSFFIRSKFMKTLFLFVSIIGMVSAGKKGGLLSWGVTYLFFLFIFTNLKLKKFALVTLILFFTGVNYAIIQFYRTIGDFNPGSIEVINNLLVFAKLAYDSATVYLDQFIRLGGIELAYAYSETLAHLGEFGRILYLLNPFTKFVLGVGIERGIGPFMAYELYGDTIPHGVNPTLFFEFIFVIGNIYWGGSAILFLFLIFIFQVVLINALIRNSSNILRIAGYYSLLLGTLSFQADTLNTIRSIPFFILPLICFHLERILLSLRRSHNNLSTGPKGIIPRRGFIG